MRVKANGITFNYRVDGPENAPWLVLSNSLATNVSMWDPQVAALRKNPRVALTIDTGAFPPKVLLIRGDAEVELVPGIPEGYLTAGRKVMTDEQYPEWVAGVQGLYDEMVVITVTPTWAKLLDFETTIPKAVEDLIKEKQAG